MHHDPPLQRLESPIDAPPWRPRLAPKHQLRLALPVRGNIPVAQRFGRHDPVVML